MAGSSDIIAYGFGSWSTIAKVPTHGFGISVVAITSDWYQCASDIRTLILAMSIDEFTTDTVNIRKLPWNRSALADGGLILSDGRPSRSPAGNLRDEAGHSVLLTAFIATNRSVASAAELQTLLGWRESLRNGLVGQTLTAAYQTDIVPGTVVIPEAFDAQYDATQLTVLCKQRV